MLNKLLAHFTAKSNDKSQAETAVYAPVSGKTVELTEVPDPAFSGRMLGDGLAVEPESEQVVAPFDGTVVSIFPTGHALGLRAVSGLECLIHVGVDTVSLEGKGFRLLAAEGQTVSRGTPLIELDLPLLRASGKTLVTPVVITNGDTWQIGKRISGQPVTAGTDLLFTASCN